MKEIMLEQIKEDSHEKKIIFENNITFLSESIQKGNVIIDMKTIIMRCIPQYSENMWIIQTPQKIYAEYNLTPTELLITLEKKGMIVEKELSLKVLNYVGGE
ncbi:hypothetical protein [Methanosphaera sp.]|jgi:hypothetical protein|uniref:hypothetical protein n=1 Tax=Methanosphaera sp. TaxID=2666342 RepID=UPI003D909022